MPKKNPSSLNRTKRLKRKNNTCAACLFRPASCRACPYQQALIDLLEHSLDIIHAMPLPPKRNK